MKNVLLSLLLIFSFSKVMAAETDSEMDLKRRIALAEKAQKEVYYKNGLDRSTLAGKVISVIAPSSSFYGVVQLLDGTLCSIDSASVSLQAQFEVCCYDKDGKILHQEYIPYSAK